MKSRLELMEILYQKHPDRFQKISQTEFLTCHSEDRFLVNIRNKENVHFDLACIELLKEKGHKYLGVKKHSFKPEGIMLWVDSKMDGQIGTYTVERMYGMMRLLCYTLGYIEHEHFHSEY